MKRLLSFIIALIPLCVFADIVHTSQYYLANLKLHAKDQDITEDINTSFVNSGYTWWYEAETPFYNGEDALRSANFGIEVGDSTEIDGETWHQLNVRLAKHIANNSSFEWLTKIPLDYYVREDNEGKLYSYAPDNAKEYIALYASYRPRCLHFMGKIGDEFAVFGDRFKVDQISEINPCGTPLLEYHASVVDQDEFALFTDLRYIAGVGVIGICGAYSEAFFDSFTPGVIGGYWCPPVLNYVTDVDDNIVYIGAGGDKIWEEYASVANVLTEDDNGNAEYFNLQGIKVDNPTHGVFLRRTAAGTSKVTIP